MRTMPRNSREGRIQLNLKYSDLTDSQKRQIGERVIENIRDRTLEGVDPDTGEAYPGYSESYKNSAAYKALKGGDTPNLRLFGTMMSNLQVLSTGPSSVTIGFTGEQAQKSMGNKERGRPHLVVSDADLEFYTEEVRGEGLSEEAQEASNLFERFLSAQLTNLFTTPDA